MKNIILQKTRYLKALMLTMLVGFFAFDGIAQNSFTDPGTFTSGQPAYAGEEAVFSYDADDNWDAGTTFILWDDADFDNRVDPDETVFGTSTEQDAIETITFDWPDNVVRLRFRGFSGDTFLEDTDNFSVQNEEVTAVGTNNSGFLYFFGRTSLRQATTAAYDLSSTAPVRVDVNISSFGLDVDNPVEVLYSTDGFATAGTVLDDVNTDDEFDASGIYTFELPNGAKTANTSLRVRQKGTIDYGTGKAWRLNSINVIIGDEYTIVNTLGYDAPQIINIPFINITGTLDEGDNPETNFYPGDEVTLVADLQNVELTDLSFVASIVNNNTGEEYLLDDQTTPVKDNGTKEININGDIPTDIGYNTAFNGWDFKIQAYEGSEPLFGVNETVDFSGGIPADYTSTTTQVNGARGIRFDESGERSLLTPEFNITSTDGVLTLTFQRRSDLISPEGTDLIVEYTTDGETFTELTSIGINELIYDVSNSTNTTIEIDSWPAGVVSSSTQFRVRQEANNGADLDGWYFREFQIENETNIVPNSTITEALSAFTLPRPVITAENIEVGGDGLAFAMEELTYTYTIDEGAFPAGTSAQLLLDRITGPEADIIVGTTADITSGSIEFTVPPIEAGDYNVYLRASNMESFSSETLSIYDNELTITNITYENPVVVAGEEFGSPGSGITVEYSLLGTPGASAEIMLSIEDDASQSPADDFVMIAASNSVSNNGTITGTLPTNFDYTNPPNLQLSLGNGGVYSDSPFDEEIYQEFFYANDPIPASVTFEGNSDFNGYHALTAAGQRSITTEAFSLPYGGQFQSRYYFYNYNGIPQDILLQGSTDGTTWVDIDTRTISSNQSFIAWDVTLPNTVWSENTQLRIIYNENGSNGFETNIFAAERITINAPEFLETSAVESDFNLIVPTLSVDSDFDPDPSYIGQEYTATYNAIGFPAGTEFAAVIEQGNAYYVAGSSAVQGAGSITFTMPIVLPIDEDNPNDDYDLYIYPYSPATAGDTYMVGQTIEADMDEDFLINTGDIDGDEDYFEMSLAGQREILTRAFDLSAATSATLSFDYYLDDDFEITANKNVVPRLEVSIDGGATFETINVEDLAPGEMSMYDEGLLYEDDDYEVEIPSEFLTEATHFRWSQPLNLGDGEQVWEVEDIEIELNGGNALSEDVYEEDNTEFTDIDINNPSLGDYTWMQVDLQDAVFNGDTFDYSWDYADGLDATTAEVFPAGTEFIFSLDGEMDPETGENVVIATTSTLGVGQATVPIFVSNGAKQVNVTAVLEVEGEDYIILEDENTGNTLDVFNQVLNTTFSGNANEVYYAGNEVTIDYAFENDVTSESIADLQYNLILEYGGDDWLLAVDESFTGSFTVDMPPFVNGTVDFEVRASVGGPLGTIGETLENSGIDLDVAESWINEEVALVDDNNLPGGTAAELASVSGRRVLTTADLDLVEANSKRLSFNLTVSDGGPATPIDVNNVLEDQQLIFEYSTDGGATYTELETFFTEGDQDGLVPINISRNYVLDGDILTSSTRFRFRQEESRYTVFIENMAISEAGAAQIDFVSADENGFVPSISQQSIQITSIDSEEACVSDEVTLNYEIRGKFGADNKVMVEYGDGADLRADVINVAANELGSFLGQNNATTGSYPVEFTKDNNTQRRVYTDYFDISGGTAGEVTIDVSTLSNLNNDLEVRIRSFSTFRVAGYISSGGTSTFTLNSNELTSNTRIEIIQFGNPLEGEDVWTLNGIQFEIFGAVSVEGYEFEVTEGSGSVAVQLPSDLFTDGDSNKDLRFRLVADDNTFEGINQDYEVTGTFNEVPVEVVAPINQNATFNTTEPLECNSEDVIATINGMQDYFLYEIIDADGTVLGSLLNDPEMPMNEINIGQITEATDLELRVSSQSSIGTVCNTAVVDEDDVEVLANFELYSKLDVDQSWKLVQAEASLNSCNGAGEVELSVRRLLANGSTTTNNASVEWFRDNLNNLVSTDLSIDDSDIEMSGEYFARVTTGSCVYTTEAIQINIEPTPAQPTITVVSGDLAACSSAEPVVLGAPEGFAFYSWSNGASTRTITVEDGGSYSVQVSNLPFVNGCSSPSSATVDVDRYETPELSLREGTSVNSSLIADGAEIEACESYTVYFFEDNSWGNDGNLEVIKDGASYATLEGDDTFTIEEDGTYSFVWSYDAINVDGCTTTSNEFTVSLIDAPTTAPTLTADGELNFCEGEGTVTLTAPEGFSYYTWRRGNTTINSTNNGFGSSNVIEVSTDGIYTVTVANSTDGCESPRSNGIDVNVVAEPSIPGLNQVNATCGDGAVEFSLTNFNGAAMTYQLYNGETGEVSGSPVTIQSGQSGSIFTDVLTENGIPFYVEVMYADGTGCSNVDPSETETAEVKTISLEVQGSTLIANYDMSEGHDVRWFRNDVLLANAAGSSLTINDAASYVIEVEYDNGCVITASSADIAGKVLGNQDAMAMNVVSYPNPTLSDVTLNVNSQYMGKHEVIVTSMTGQIMMQSSFDKSSFEAEHAMNVANLEEGIYNVQIRHDGLTQNVRIIKK